ncbi:MAG: hypothetical protein GY821_11090, partial [Gammaproteobacteria bacterium]|nr:hypothetical protein [Gammaproteobacteria bacterium]
SVEIRDVEGNNPIKCNTPMLIMKTNNPRAECLLGVYALRQMGFMLFAPTGEELLGQDVSKIPSDKCPKVDAPVKLPKTTHTQVNLLKCYSAKPLELGPMHKGRIKMKVPECNEKGAYLFTPSDEGQAAGLRQSSVLLNKSGQFRLKVANCSMQQSLSMPGNAIVGTIGKAHLMDVEQFRAEVEKREVEQLSKGHMAVSVGSPLEVSDIVCPHKTSCRRKGRIKTNLLQQEPSHQMTLRQTQNLNFDCNVNSILRCMMMDSKRIEVAYDRDRMAKPILRSLSEESTAEQ